MLHHPDVPHPYKNLLKRTAEPYTVVFNGFLILVFPFPFSVFGLLLGWGGFRILKSPPTVFSPTAK